MNVQIKSGNWPEEIDWNISGGDNENPTWEEYLAAIKDEYKGHFVAMREAVENGEFYKASGEVFCNGHYFEFEDGITCGFSWRAWGDFMQAIVGKKEGYMTYYM